MTIAPSCQHGIRTTRLFASGGAGVGDAYYPGLGNEGYDAQHYDIALKVEPKGNKVKGHSTMQAMATQELDDFHLDFHGMQVDKVMVNGQPARFRREEDELIVIPKAVLPQGQKFEVSVDYSGSPQAKDSVAGPFTTGWKANGRGVVVDSQPDGAQTWFPVNDHPLDKATFSMQVEVPKPFVVAANGTLLGVDDHGATQTYKFSTRDPLAPYLATVNVGNYVREDSQGPKGVPIRNYFPPELAKKAHHDFGRTGEMMELFGKLFGDYPFENYGVVVVNDRRAVSGAMETQTLSLFEPALVTGDRSNEDVVAHELAHHWFGNLVSVAQWQDLWLNEGFASYGEWLWTEHTEGPKALEKKAESTRHWLSGQPGITLSAPPKDDLFHSQVYVKGALAVHEMRREVGDEAFFRGIRSYLDQHKGEGASNATIMSLQEAVEKSSGRSLQTFFQQWVHSPELPGRVSPTGSVA